MTARRFRAARPATVSNAAVGRPTDLFVTKATLQRRKAAPNLQAEAKVFCELSKMLADDPRAALLRVLEVARDLCQAGSAGLSLLRDDAAGLPVVRWATISGALASHEGMDTPRDSSPCGLCLDAGTTIRVSRPERAFTSLRDTQPAIVETLIVPLYDNASKVLGTLWMAHHDPKSRFSADDARVVEQLAAQAVLAMSLLERAREHRLALALLESSESESRRALVLKDAMLHEVNHRTKNTLQAAGALLCLHAAATSSAPVRVALRDSYARLQLIAKVHELLYRKAGSEQTVLMSELFQAMGNGLRQSFAGISAQVRLELTADPITLPVDQAIPLALFTNEVVTNAYKHAFPNGSSGEITVSLRQPPESALSLQIVDTGIGLKPTGGETGMGLKLMRIFATQLRGSLIFATPAAGAGTALTLTI